MGAEEEVALMLLISFFFVFVLTDLFYGGFLLDASENIFPSTGRRMATFSRM